MTTDKKTAEEILTMNGIWNYADNIKISRKDLIELMEKYAYQFKNNTNIDIEDEIRYGNENTAPYHNFNTTPAPIQKGEVDVEKQAENFFNLNYSGTKTSDFLKPYIINTYIQAHSQAKQGGYRKEDIIKCLEAQYIRKGENPRYNEAVKVCITAVQSLPQAHPDHIPDTGKLVKTMSAELPSDEEMHTAIVAEFRSDCYGIAERAIELFRSKIKYPLAPMTIEEAKEEVVKRHNLGTWKLILMHEGISLTERDKYIDEAMQLYAQSQQPK